MEFARDIARTILEGFDRHYRLFRDISARAKERFERGDWAAVKQASRDRIGFYDQRVKEAVQTLHTRFPEARKVERLWPMVKQAYIPLLYDHHQPECAETFYNSVACRVLDRTYYRNEYIFSRPAVSTDHIRGTTPTYRSYYPGEMGLLKTLEALVVDFGLARPFQDLRRDIRWVARALREHFPAPRRMRQDFQIQVLPSLFYRNQAAYIVGRAINDGEEHPFAVPIRHAEGGGLYLDALLMSREDVGRLFSLGRAYFMVDMEVPSAWMQFLRALMPSKPIAELYTSVGLQKQGKTQFYRDLADHLVHSRDRFVLAPGTRGMVMMVFSLPSFPYVFKVIRDWFDAPKDVSARDVREKYLIVKLHDRVGRMADTLEFSDVDFPLARFDAELLSELRRLCGDSVVIEGDRLIIKHLYVQRRLIPLDVWLRDAEPARAHAAIDDYGRAIDELATANIFPGDLLLKNFGVTRWGRVVFYDYDEINLLTEVQFRGLPRARDDDEEMAAEPWFQVGPHDVFPEQFPNFLFRAGPQRELFMRIHGALADPRHWQRKQAQIEAGFDEPFYPYPESRRLPVRFGAGRREPTRDDVDQPDR